MGGRRLDRWSDRLAVAYSDGRSRGRMGSRGDVGPPGRAFDRSCGHAGPALRGGGDLARKLGATFQAFQSAFQGLPTAFQDRPSAQVSPAEMLPQILKGFKRRQPTTESGGAPRIPARLWPLCKGLKEALGDRYVMEMVDSKVWPCVALPPLGGLYSPSWGREAQAQSPKRVAQTYSLSWPHNLIDNFAGRTRGVQLLGITGPRVGGLRAMEARSHSFRGHALA